MVRDPERVPEASPEAECRGSGTGSTSLAHYALRGCGIGFTQERMRPGDEFNGAEWLGHEGRA